MDFDRFAEIVKEFNTTFNCKKDVGFNLLLFLEELGEMCSAKAKDKTFDEQQNEWADTLFVWIGLGQNLGFNMKSAMEYVGQKNLKKILNKDKMRISSEGKVIKESDHDEMVPQLCSRQHLCMVEGPCNGLPRDD